MTLSNGFEALVVDFNPQQPVRPTVQFLGTPAGEAIADPSQEEIDLATTPELDIVSIGDYDVRPYLDSQR